MGQTISTLFSGFGITDVIDIAIVSFIIYKILGYIRRSRAEQLAKGLIIIIAAFLISGVAHLYIVNWILSGILSVGIIALVVVFQPVRSPFVCGCKVKTNFSLPQHPKSFFAKNIKKR